MAIIREYPREIRFLYLSIFLCTGVIIGCLDIIHQSLFISLTVLASFLLFGTVIYLKRFFFISFYFIIILIGIGLAQQNRAQPNSSITSYTILFKGILQETPKTINNNTYGKIKITWVHSDTLCHLIDQLVLIKIKAELTQLTVHDTIFGSGLIRLIDVAKNPGSFCRKTFYAKENIHYQIVSRENQIGLNKNSGISIQSISTNFRKQIQSRIDIIFDDFETSAFIKAIFLGNKNELSNDVKDTFSKTGAAHILAVSGLHVGIIFSVILFFTGPPEKGSYTLRTLRCLFAVTIIWLYACMTGLSPSVVRAATMLSIYTFGRALNRKVSAWNVVGAAVFFIVLLNPLIILQIGFQFSFAAVAGILLLYLPINKGFQTKHKWLNKIWQMNAVTLSAQLFIVPLSIYYFHQFPTTFLISSLIAIPVAISILIGSMAIISLSLISLSLSQFSSKVIEGLYQFLLDALHFLQNFQPDSWSNLVINEFQLFGIFAGTISLILFVAKRKMYYQVAATIFFLAVIVIGHQVINDQYDKHAVSILHQYSGASVSFQSGREMLILADSKKENIHRYIYQPHLLYNRIGEFEVLSIEEETINHSGVFKRGSHVFFQDKHLVIIDQKMRIYPELIETIPVSFVLIIDPNTSLQNLIQFRNQPLFILNTSYPPWKKDSFKDFCKLKNLQFFDVAKQGAFVHQIKPVKI